MSNNKSNDNGFAYILRLLFWTPIIIVFICTGKCEGPATACNELQRIIKGETDPGPKIPDLPGVKITPGQTIEPPRYIIDVPKNGGIQIPHGPIVGPQVPGSSTVGIKSSGLKLDYQVETSLKKTFNNPVGKFGSSGEVYNQLPLQTNPAIPGSNTTFPPFDKLVPEMKTYPTNESKRLGFKK